MVPWSARNTEGNQINVRMVNSKRYFKWLLKRVHTNKANNAIERHICNQRKKHDNFNCLRFL